MTLIQKIQKLRAKKGFTLVELIVVIAILAVLMAILIPTMMNFVEDSRIKSANTAAKNFFDTTKVYTSRTEASATGLLKGDAGTVLLAVSVTNPDGKTPTFDIEVYEVELSESTDAEGVTTITVDVTTEISGTDLDDIVEGGAKDAGQAWVDGLEAHLVEQMPNATNGATVFIECRRGAVVQTVYTTTAVEDPASDTAGYEFIITDVFQGKNDDGAIIGSSPTINENVERPATP